MANWISRFRERLGDSTPLSGADEPLEGASVKPPAAPRRDPRVSGRAPAAGPVDIEWFDAQGELQRAALRLWDQSPPGLGLESPRSFSAGQAVVIKRLEGEPLLGIVKHCRPLPNGYHRVGVQLIEQERRRQDREPMDEPAEMVLIDRAAPAVPQAVRIKDATEGGVVFESALPLAAETAVRIVLGDWTRVGRVVHVRPHGEAYRLGIQFVEPPQRRPIEQALSQNRPKPI